MTVLDRTVQRLDLYLSSVRLTPIALLVILLIPMVPVQAQSVSPSVPPSVSPSVPPSVSPSVPPSAMDEIPEEILRQELILDGRSPLDGKPLTATEYAELQIEIDRLNEPTPTVSPKLQQLVLLVKLRKFLKTVLPIAPIK